MFVLDGLTLPRADNGTVRFTNVPVYVSDLGPGIDGVLGMNLFNTAVAMMYDPYGSGMLSVLFTEQVEHGSEVDVAAAVALEAVGVPFADTFQGTSMPAFAVANGALGGRVFLDYDVNGTATMSEQPIGGVTLYLDANGNGQLDDHESRTFSNADGTYAFSALLPGDYVVRAAAPFNLVVVTPGGGGYGATVTAGNFVGGLDFGLVSHSVDENAAYVDGLYGTFLGRPPDEAGAERLARGPLPGRPQRDGFAPDLGVARAPGPPGGSVLRGVPEPTCRRWRASELGQRVPERTQRAGCADGLPHVRRVPRAERERLGLRGEPLCGHPGPNA
jgi:hypothetical protein